jgi:hypothetical protein
LGMMGYGRIDQKTAGIHMRLRARAFVLSTPCNGALYQQSCHQGQSSTCHLSSGYSEVSNNASCCVPLRGL